MMKERRIRERVNRCEEILMETKSRIKIGGEIEKEFQTRRKVRQECPLSPSLFNILIADLEEELKRREQGEIKVKRKKIYTLAYADVVLLAKEEEGMRVMIYRLERYLREKGLELNLEICQK